MKSIKMTFDYLINSYKGEYNISIYKVIQSIFSIFRIRLQSKNPSNLKGFPLFFSIFDGGGPNQFICTIDISNFRHNKYK